MQNKYGKDGLVALSVQAGSLDEKAELPTKVANILKSKQATKFKTVILNEKEDVWQKKLRFTDFPCIYVFNRQGKWTQFRSQDKEYNETEVMLAAVDRLVEKLVKQK
jgi:hypothetical protein